MRVSPHRPQTFVALLPAVEDLVSRRRGTFVSRELLRRRSDFCAFCQRGPRPPQLGYPGTQTYRGQSPSSQVLSQTFVAVLPAVEDLVSRRRGTFVSRELLRRRSDFCAFCQRGPRPPQLGYPGTQTYRGQSPSS